MAYSTLTRYGYRQTYDTLKDAEQVILRLLSELKREEFETPDDEHTQVSLANGNIAITVQVSGLVTLEKIDPEEAPEESLYRRDVPDRELVPLLFQLASGNMITVQEADWSKFDDLLPYKRDFYRVKKRRA